MRLTLRVWRQKNADAEGAMSTYEVDGISPTCPSWRCSTPSTRN